MVLKKEEEEGNFIRNEEEKWQKGVRGSKTLTIIEADIRKSLEVQEISARMPHTITVHIPTTRESTYGYPANIEINI